MSKLNLSMKQIADAEFDTVMRGYSKENVDDLLQLVIHDYATYNKTIKLLQEEVTRLRSEVEYLNTKAQTAQQQVQQPQVAAPAPQSNHDIIVRLSRLETAVFGTENPTV